MMYSPVNEKGFTLAEILIALAIVGIVSTAILGVFITQNRSFVAQEQVVDMQQNLRAAVDVMSREIRMAGYDSQQTGGWGFFPAGTAPTPDSTSFTFDLNDNGALDGGEQVSFDLDAGNNLDRNGQLMAPDIEALAFAYAIEFEAGDLYPDDPDIPGDDLTVEFLKIGADGAGDLADPNTHWFELDGTDTGLSVTAFPPDSIRLVRVWVLARSQSEDPNFRHQRSFEVAGATLNFDDNVRRRLLETTIQVRNLGL